MKEPEVKDGVTLPDPPAAGKVITQDGAGPFRKGMTVEEIRKLPNLTASPTKRALAGKIVPTLTLMRWGRTLAMAELEGDHVQRVVVVAPDYATQKGARVGDAARGLKLLYGEGRVYRDEGTVCASFAKAPGLGFCFRVPKSFQDAPDLTWSKLLEKNPRVVGIIVGART